MEKVQEQIPDNCRRSIIAIKDIQDIMGGKWKYLIITSLCFLGKLKFMELKRNVGNIAPKVLSKELKDLEINNLITRTVCNTKPITVEYELTDLGQSLKEVIESMGTWVIQYRESILKERI